MIDQALLTVQDLEVEFASKGALGRNKHVVKAVNGVSFSINKGDTFGIVGESGSGKTTTALAIMRLVRATKGKVSLGDMVLTDLQGEALRRARRRFQMVFQDPFSSLNPRLRARDVVAEPLAMLDRSNKDNARGLEEVFAQVGLRPEQMDLFPHQFSGGQRQRIALARALVTRPELIVCDEPVSALDVAIQAQILNLLKRIQHDLDVTYLFISHDLGVVQYICDWIAVMYLGQIVEVAPRASLFSYPLHPYTLSLLSAVPSASPGTKAWKAITLKGEPPSLINLPTGCIFADRCPVMQPECQKSPPALRELSDGRRVACHFVEEKEGTVQNTLTGGLEMINVLT